MTLLVSVVGVGSLAVDPGIASATPPSELTFTSPPQVITAGQTVQLQWGAVPSGDFVIFGMPSSPSGSGFDFSSPSQVKWPMPPGGSYSSTYGFWSSTAASVNIVIPSGLPAPSQFEFSLTTCNLSTGCSATDEVTLTIVDFEHPASSQMTAFAGSTVALNWPNAPSSGDYYLFTNPSDSYPLSFSSSSVITWAGASYNSTWHWWSSTTGGLSIAIPSGAGAGSTFTFNLYTCNTGGGCTNSPGGPGAASITITVAGSEWSQTPYSSAFSTVDSSATTGSGFTAVAFSPDANDTLWGTAEYGASVSGNSASYPALYTTAGSSSLVGITNGFDATAPFAACFRTYGCPPTAVSATYSALAESMTYAGGRVWWTEGGWEFYGGGPAGQSNPPQNNSEIISSDPSSPNSSLCVYEAPAPTSAPSTNDPEVAGITSTVDPVDNVTRIWFIAQDPDGGHPYVGSFEPSQVGCPSLGTAQQLSSSTPSYTETQLWATGTNAWEAGVPNQIAGDPSDGSVWIDTTYPSTLSGVSTYVFHVSTTGTVTPGPAYASTNSYSYPYGIAYAWDIVADDHYVYVADIRDGNIMQIEKSGPDPGAINRIPVPAFADKDGVFGLALHGNNLYFTDAQTFGVINIATWEAASQACPGTDCAPAPTSATVYTGLMPVVDSGTGTYGFNGIAVSSSGEVGLDQNHGHLVRLTP
jgi:hypothetical protein